MAIMWNPRQEPNPWERANQGIQQYLANSARRREYEEQQKQKLLLAGYKPLDRAQESTNPMWDLLPKSVRDKEMRQRMPERFKGADVVVGDTGFKAPSTMEGAGSVEEYNENFLLVTQPGGKISLKQRPQGKDGSFGHLKVQTDKGARIATINKRTGAITVTNKKPIPQKDGAGGSGSERKKQIMDRMLKLQSGAENVLQGFERKYRISNVKALEMLMAGVKSGDIKSKIAELMKTQGERISDAGDKAAYEKALTELALYKTIMKGVEFGADKLPKSIARTLRDLLGGVEEAERYWDSIK